MKILIVGPSAQEKGGIATVIANFKQYYQKQEEHQFSFLETWSNVHKWRIGWRAFTQIKKIIREQKIDIVHFHVAQKGSFFRKALLAKLVPSNVKVIFHMHASQFDVFYKKCTSLTQMWIQKSFNSIDKIVVLSETWAAFYSELTQTAISVIPNAVQIPSESYYHNDAELVVTFGRIGIRKGSYDILKVAKKLQNDFPSIRFILYGDGEIEKIARIIEEEAIQNVELGGWISKQEQAKVLQKTTLHLLPSYHEGLPMAILETMAAGIPNLSTFVGGIPDVIKCDENGILITAGNLKQLELKLREFLLSKEIRQKYSENARKTIQCHFSFEKVLKRWQRLYNELNET